MVRRRERIQDRKAWNAASSSRYDRLLIASSVLCACAVLALVLWAIAASASSCSDSWASPVSGAWNTPADWSTGVVPSSSDEACITTPGTYTVTLTGSISVKSLTLGATSGSAKQTLLIGGPASSGTLKLAANSTINQAGVLDMESGTGTDAIVAPETAVVENHGEALSLAHSTNFLETNLTNAAAGTVEVKSGELRQDENTTTTNEGAFKIAASATFAATTSKDLFVNKGSLSNAGTSSLTNNASWTQEAATATQSGNPVSIFNSGTLTDVSGAGSFDLIDSAVLSGTIPKGQAVTADAIPSHNAEVKITGTVTNEGTLALDSPAGGGLPSIEKSSLSSQVNNDGLLTAQSESSQSGRLEVALSNEASGTVEVKSGELRQDENTTTTNKGSFDVLGAATFAATTSSDLFVNKGSLSNAGTSSLTNNASWTQEAATATQSGNPVSIFNSGTLTDVSGAGSFELVDTPVLSGTIPTGQTVTATPFPPTTPRSKSRAPSPTKARSRWNRLSGAESRRSRKSVLPRRSTMTLC